MRVTGLHRGSLDSAFGSTRGVFARALTHAKVVDDGAKDVALLELSPRDEGVRQLAARLLGRLDLPAEALGRRLLVRAGLDADDGGPTHLTPKEIR